jgi:hypothetical protein
MPDLSCDGIDIFREMNVAHNVFYGLYLRRYFSHFFAWPISPSSAPQVNCPSLTAG